jgi:hypothetical protein
VPAISSTVVIRRHQFLKFFWKIDDEKEQKSDDMGNGGFIYGRSKSRTRKIAEKQSDFATLLSLVFCFQNCSDLLWEKIVLVIEKNFWNLGWRPRISKIFEITWTIYSNSERSDQFLEHNAFLTCSWRFLRSNILEQL